MNPRTARAEAMAPDDRRAAILTATIPLLRERGVNATTRELAEAAGVAEGTLFRVFPSKGALLGAAIRQATDPQPLVDELRAIDPALDLRTALTIAVGLMTARSADAASLMATAHELACRSAETRQTAEVHHPGHGGPGHHAGGRGGPHLDADGRHPFEAVVDAVAELLDRHAEPGRLRRGAVVSAQMLVAVALAGARPAARGGAPAVEPDAVVELFLHGALVPGAAAASASATTPAISSEQPC